MYEHNALGYWSGLALCLTKVRSSRARCPATALIILGEHRCHIVNDCKTPLNHSVFHDMYEYDKTFDRKVFLGHCDLISCSVILPYISTLSCYFFILLSDYE